MNTPFLQLSLKPEIQKAIETMGFENATEIQARSIPLIQQGADVIGRSQTGTGKTLAFGIPAVEKIDPNLEKPQVLILCPTRELAMQACEEVRKLAAFMPGVRCADVYGGAPMDRQIIRLKRANLIIGTPGRVMDHMRRRTLKLDELRMIVLDEADEMLSMGFREDIETILQETPQTRQTILFSATMPPAIMALTQQYQSNPQIVEVERKQVTVENIEQYFYNIPMGRKMDALNLILRYYQPNRCMIFCNTKSMVDEIASFLSHQGFNTEGLHGDMRQSQRSKVMDAFKLGKVTILVATDVAARGIDVNDIDYVINYDIPQSSEYYVHRIGRTGRAGKSGAAITLCSGRRQVGQLMATARMVKARITECDIPSAQIIRERTDDMNLELVKKFIAEHEDSLYYASLIENLNEEGIAPEIAAAALMEIHFGRSDKSCKEIKVAKTNAGENRGYGKIILSIGRSSRVAPNHIVGAITERTNLSGRDIGKIEIFDDYSVVGIPKGELPSTVELLKGLKICGKPTTARELDGEDYIFKAGGKTDRNASRGGGRGTRHTEYSAKRYSSHHSSSHGNQRQARRKER